jgi:hypothetical protein
LAGANYSYKVAKGPRERRFVVWASVLLVGFILLFLATVRLFPQAKVWFWTSYPFILVFGIRYLNRKQTAIGRGERTKGVYGDMLKGVPVFAGVIGFACPHNN